MEAGGSMGLDDELGNVGDGMEERAEGGALHTWR